MRGSPLNYSSKLGVGEEIEGGSTAILGQEARNLKLPGVTQVFALHVEMNLTLR
jgi:hypothetical protein